MVGSAWSQPTLNIGVVPGYPGAAKSVPVNLAGAANAVAFQFDVAFNPAKASLESVLAGARLTNHLVRFREISPGLWRGLVYSVTNAALISTNIEVASLSFTVAPTEFVGSGPLVPTNIVVSRADASALSPVTARAGAIFVRPVNRREDGIVDFFLLSAPDQRYLIQATTDFIRWETIGTNVATGSFMALVDADGPKYPHRFYRWMLYDAAGEIGSAEATAGGTMTFRVNGLNGRAYRVQASTNLIDWQTINTPVATDGKIDFVDPDAPQFRQRFYRLQSGP